MVETKRSAFSGIFDRFCGEGFIMSMQKAVDGFFLKTQKVLIVKTLLELAKYIGVFR